LILFLTLQQILEQHYLAGSSSLLLNNNNNILNGTSYNYNNFTLSYLFNHFKNLYID
jgi:hypothetical protein